MSTTASYKQFEFVQRAVAKFYKREFFEYRRSYSKIDRDHLLSLRHYNNAMTLMWFIIISGIAYQASISENVLSRPAIDVVGLAFTAALACGLLGFITIKFLQYAKMTWKKHKLVEYIGSFLTFFIVPSFMTFGAYLFSFGVGTNTLFSFGVILQIWFLLLISTYFITNFWLYCVIFAPVILLSLGSSKMSLRDEIDELSFDLIARNVLAKLENELVTFTKSAILAIKIIADRKYTGLTSQAQTLSPILGAFSLFGLFALALNQEQVQLSISIFEAFLFRVFAVNVQGLVGVLAIIILFVLIAFSSMYFYRVYFALRVLEILIISCDLRLIELEKGDTDYREKK